VDKLLVMLASLLLIGSPGGVFAAPCVNGSVSDYVSLGITGCSVGGLDFSSFTVESFPGPAPIQINPSSVQLIPLADGFVLNSGTALSASAGELLGLRFGFHVAAAGGLTGGTVALGDTEVTPDGVITSLLDAGADGSAIAIDIGVDIEPLASFSAAPTSFFDVFFELGIDGGLGGSAIAGPDLGSINFTTATPGTAPEPGTILLLLASVLAVVLLRHRRVAHASSRA
jgi:hypothetical protein